MPAIRFVQPCIAAAILLLAACSGSNAPAPAPAAPAADAKALIEARAANDLKLYEQMRASQSWDLAAPLGKELIGKYPDTAAARQVQQTLADVTDKAAKQIENHRLSRLWSYAAVPEAGATQYTAALQTKEALVAGTSPNTPPRARLILRQHPKWGQSVYLLLDAAKFDCSKGCATLPVSFDSAPAQRMKAVIPPTGEPALFIDDDKSFIAKMQKTKTVVVDVTIKDLGPRSLSFEVGGYDPTKLPNAPKR